LNIYATVATLGLLRDFQVFCLPQTLQGRSHPWVIGIAIALYLIEFFADKISFFDTLRNPQVHSSTRRRSLGLRRRWRCLKGRRISPTLDDAVRFGLSRGNAGRAVELLEQTKPYELGAGLYPAYVRGLAYLRSRQGGPAAIEFQKILDHRGIAGNSDAIPLARLGLARARAMSGNTSGARTAYQDLFALWKDADPDIPILKQAKVEYAKLQ
jgi:hypothetical protein